MIKIKNKLNLDLPLPSEKNIAILAQTIIEAVEKEKIIRRYAPVKHVLSFIGAVGLITFAFTAPGAAPLINSIVKSPFEEDKQKWKQYNPHFLHRTLRRLEKQKLVSIEEQNGETTVTLTKDGQRRILKYALESLAVPKPKTWDSRWRLVIYDVSDKHEHLRNIFREALRNLGFYKLQESVWLYPYPCEKEITFLKEYYSVGNEVIYIVANVLEDDAPYRTYFGI